MSRIGRYEVVRELGRGAMGVVFEARLPGSDERVALKLLHAATPDVTARFRREGRILELLGAHPNVVRLRELGEDRGRPFIVMDLLTGGTFEERIQREPPGSEAMIRTVVRVARALHFAHEAGIVHRDVKPANVLLDKHGEPRVTDFGVAKDASAEALTRTGAVVGTLEYVAPEQLDRARDVDRRADVYALGAMLHRVVAGAPPFAASSAVELMKKVVLEPPPPLRTRNAALAAVVGAALDKDPARRPRSAEDLARAVEEALQPAARARRTALGPVVTVLVGAAAAAAGAALASRAASGERARTRVLASLAADHAPPEEALAAFAGPDHPFVLARSRLLAGKPPLEGLPDGPGRKLVELEAALARGDLDQAAALGEETADLAATSWAPASPGERAAALAERLSVAGDARAVRAWMRAGGRLGGARALACFERAVESDATDAALAPEAALAFRTLRDAALAALEGSPSPRAVVLARRRLLHARLLAPGESLAAARPRLDALARSESDALRIAARPWSRYAVYARLHEAPIDARLSPEDAGAVPIGTSWHPELTRIRGIHDAELRREAWSEVVTFRGDVATFWFEAGRALCDAGRFSEGVRGLRLASGLAPRSPEAHFYEGKYLLAWGSAGEAVRAYERCWEAHRAEVGNRPLRGWYAIALVEAALMASPPELERAWGVLEAFLASVPDPRKEEAGTTRHFWEIAARLAQRRGDEARRREWEEYARRAPVQ